MNSLILYNVEKWTIKRFGMKKSLMIIGLDGRLHQDYLADIPHHLYNRVIDGRLKIDAHYEYEKQWLYFIDSSNNVIRKLLI